MKIYNICVKIFVLFFIFYSGKCDNNTPLLNNNICNQIKDSKYIPFKRRLVYYSCKHRGTHRIRRFHNPYAVIAKDLLRKYVYICNIVVIYLILYCL